MIKFKVKGVYGAVKSMGRVIHWAQIEIPKLTGEEAEFGANYAKDIAPEQTGSLIQAINVKPGSGKNSSKFIVVSRTPKSPGNPNKAGNTVPYQVFLHKGLRGSYHGTTKTGDHRYMYTTASVMRNKYPEKTKKSLSKTMKSTK